MSISGGNRAAKEVASRFSSYRDLEEQSVDSDKPLMYQLLLFTISQTSSHTMAMAMCSPRNSWSFYQFERRRHIVRGTRWVCASHFLLNTVMAARDTNIWNARLLTNPIRTRKECTNARVRHSQVQTFTRHSPSRSNTLCELLRLRLLVLTHYDLDKTITHTLCLTAWKA